MRLILACLLLALPIAAQAQAIVTSAGPETSSVTVYRDPDRGEGGISASFPTGFALITETRRIALPAGESTVRFEGVADGMIAVSAVVTGLPGGVVQKNRDARLLSPAALLDGSLGNRVHLRRTSRATGKVTDQDAIIRSGPDGAVVLQTSEGVEALRCSGIPESLSYDSVPAGLAARPTLSVTTVSPSATSALVTLTYLSTGFDWGANYVAKVAKNGRTLDLFAWLTVANGNASGFVDAQLMAVAGRVNREADYDSLVENAPSPSLHLQCWPMATTSTDSPPPPPMSASMMMADMSEIVVTAQRRNESLAAAPVVKMAKQEELGDLKLYRVPMRVDVNAHGQKQVALLQKSAVPFHLYYAAKLWPLDPGDESQPMAKTLRMQNRANAGLGLPLPSGGVALFEQADGESLLLANSDMRDHAIGEEAEIDAGRSAQVRIRHIGVAGKDGTIQSFRIEVTNALDKPVPVEVQLARPDGYSLIGPSRTLGEKDGAWLWAQTVPANGKAEFAYRLKEDR